MKTKTTYIIQLEVDEEWLEAINKLTNDVYENEVCTWISLKENTGGNNG
jgi:hypothetical protein